MKRNRKRWGQKLTRSNDSFPGHTPSPRDLLGRADVICQSTPKGIDALWERAVRAPEGAQVKSRGQFFTPRKLVAEVVEATLRPFKEGGRTSLTIIDPACGHGAFLLGAMQWCHANGISPKLIGYDVDPAVAQRAHEVLEQAGRLYGCVPFLHISSQNSLLNSWRPDVADAVIGNPPWVSYSGRHAETLDESTRTDLASRYRSFAHWPCLHSCFLERSVTALSPDGRLGMLLPAQVASLERYAPLRSIVSAEMEIDEATRRIPEGIFSGVVSETLLLVAGRGGPEALPRSGSDAGWCPNISADTEMDLLSRLPKVPSECFADIGVHSGNSAQELILSQPATGALPILEGRDVHPYACDQPRRWMSTELKATKRTRFRVGDVSRMQTAPILLRQTAKRPIASPNPGLIFRNSVIAAWPWPGLDLWATLAILNSELIAAYHAQRSQESGQRTFPQLKIGHLRAFPLPQSPSSALVQELSTLARSIGQGKPSGRLEGLVRSAYGLEM